MTVGITELPPEGMQLGGVALAGDAERGTKTTEGLSLLFTTAGITVQGPQPQIERLLVWSGLDSANCHEKVALPDGRNAAVMELTSGGQAIRFLLPLDTVTPGQAAYLDQALPAWLARYKGGTASATQPPPPPPPSATGANTHEPGASGGVAGSAASPQPPTVAPPATAGPVASPPATNGWAGGSVTAPPPPPSPTAPPGPGSFDAPPPPPPTSPRRPAPAAAPGASVDAPFITGTFPGSEPSPSPAPGSASPAAPAPPTASGSTEPPPPPPPPPATTAAMAAGTAAWTGAPSPAAAGPDGQPADHALAGDAVAPGKRERGRRKSKAAPPDSLLTGATGADAPTFLPSDPRPEPPSDPPANPVPLTSVTLPPPPPDGPGGPGTPGAVVWQPPIDPATGEALWDQGGAPSDTPPKKAKGWRRGAKTGAAAAAAGAAGVVGVATAAGPEVATAPAHSRPPDAPDGGSPVVTGDAQAPKRNRPLITVLVVVLVVLIGGIAYFAVKRNNNASTTATTAATSPAPAAAASALAASVNLRLADLPTGWVRAPVTGQVPTPPLAPVPAQAQANQALAGCLGVSYQTVAGLFDNATLPGQVGAARSLTYQSGSNPNVLMYSLATVLGSTTQAQALAVPFTNPNFATCFGQYQSSLAAAAAPGATAQVQAVTLSAPAGVTAYGYLTTLTIPNQGTDVIGDAFLLGGRIETLLAPSTNGPSVPSSDFTPAFDAVAARMAGAVNR